MGQKPYTGFKLFKKGFFILDFKLLRNKQVEAGVNIIILISYQTQLQA